MNEDFNNLKTAIDQIKTDFQNGKYNGKNEAGIRQSIINRILPLVGWNTFDLDEVYPEYPIKYAGQTDHADYALLSNDECKVIIEAKNIGKQNEKSTQQIIGYAFWTGAPLVVLCDGRTWEFYFSATAKNGMPDRRFCIVDLSNDDSDKSTKNLLRFLKKDNVVSGKAIEDAENVFNNKDAQAKAMKALPEVFVSLVEDTDSDLFSLIAQKVTDACGYEPNDENISKYLSQLINHDKTPVYEATIAPIGSQNIPGISNAQMAKSSRSSFELIGIPINAELVATFNPTLKFKVVNNINKIMDLQDGSIASISRMAVKYLGGSRNGYEYFTYNGIKLADLRRQKDTNYLGLGGR